MLRWRGQTVLGSLLRLKKSWAEFMSDVVIRTENLGKLYRIGERQRSYKTLREAITNAFSVAFQNSSRSPQPTFRNPRPESIWALKNISFEVKCGEVVGIIGRNGVGKTTLLKVLSRITEPTEGWAEIYGRVRSLLEVGTGFHPELTGRENIYLNGAILGMKKGEISRKFDEIVAFAEIDKFIDTPVKRYSSGMYVRLAFAVAAHLEPEILLVDEVLAVGDATFQKKCLGKMEGVAKEGRTVLFVSHNMSSVAQLCSRAVWLNNGQLKRDGKCTDVIRAYLSQGVRSTGHWVRPNGFKSTSEVELLGVYVASEDTKPIPIVNFDKSFEIEVEYRVKETVRDLAILLSVMDSRGNIVFTTWDNDSTSLRGRTRQPGLYRSRCKMPGSFLRPGLYWVTIGAHVYNVKEIEYHEYILSFEISQVNYPFNESRLGILTPVLQWIVERQEGVS